MPLKIDSKIGLGNSKCSWCQGNHARMSAPLTGHFDKCVKSFATQSSVGALVGVTAAAIFFSKCLPVCCARHIY